MSFKKVLGGAVGFVILAVSGGALFGLSSPVLASPASEATIQFGREALGSRPGICVPPTNNNPPECFARGHDGSANALDETNPGTVVISAGGIVTFNIAPAGAPHQVAIYRPGTGPADIPPDTAANDAYLVGFAGCPGGPAADNFYDYSTNREAILSSPLCAGGASTVSHIFDDAGRYLFICTFRPHFETGMYGWVIVQ